MTPSTSFSDELLQRIRGEFLEMPGLRLTESQARRLWGLDADACLAAISTLVTAGFLFRTREGSVMRLDRAAPLRASLSQREASVA
jgi:hypothetical protein